MTNKHTELLARCVQEVEFTHVATMPIPLYQELKKAVNNHDKLVEALEEIVDKATKCGAISANNSVITIAQQALNNLEDEG